MTLLRKRLCIDNVCICDPWSEPYDIHCTGAAMASDPLPDHGHPSMPALHLRPRPQFRNQGPLSHFLRILRQIQCFPRAEACRGRFSPNRDRNCIVRHRSEFGNGCFPSLFRSWCLRRQHRLRARSRCGAITDPRTTIQQEYGVY